MPSTVRRLARSLTLVTLGATALTPRTTHAQNTPPAATASTPAATAAAQNAQAASAQRPAPIPAPLPAPGRPPAINRVNENLPKWLNLRAEFRERLEGFSNLGFTDGRDDAFALTRLRFNIGVTASKHLSFQVNLHDARLSGKELGPTAAPFRGPFDIRTGFADIGNARSPVTGTARPPGTGVR